LFIFICSFGERAGAINEVCPRCKIDKLPCIKCNVFFLYFSRLGPDKNYVGNAQSLPFGIREVDIEYQLHRIILFERLLKSYPYTRDRIIEEAMKDVPPLYRGETWAAILGVIGDVQRQYENIDKETPTSTDRQVCVFFLPFRSI